MTAPRLEAFFQAMQEDRPVEIHVSSAQDARELWREVQNGALHAPALSDPTATATALRSVQRLVQILGSDRDKDLFPKVLALWEGTAEPMERSACERRLREIAARTIEHPAQSLPQGVDLLRKTAQRVFPSKHADSWRGLDLRGNDAPGSIQGPAFCVIRAGQERPVLHGANVVAILPEKPQTKPYFKWAGRKSQLLDEILPLLRADQADVYAEPFLGTGAVFLATAFSGIALLSDVNPRVVALHQAVQRDPEGVFRALDLFPWGPGWESEYYPRRDRFNETEPAPTPEFAAAMLWLSRAQFNGLWRENRDGKLNTPVGAYTRLHRPERDHVHTVSRALRHGAVIQPADFRSALAALARLPPDLRVAVYADPPYDPTSQTATFRGYSKMGFSAAQQRALAQDLACLAARPRTRVVASNSDTPFIRALYGDRGFQILPVQVRRSISAKSEARGAVGELLLVAGSLD